MVQSCSWEEEGMKVLNGPHQHLKVLFNLFNGPFPSGRMKWQHQVCTVGIFVWSHFCVLKYIVLLIAIVPNRRLACFLSPSSKHVFDWIRNLNQTLVTKRLLNRVFDSDHWRLLWENNTVLLFVPYGACSILHTDKR